MSLERVIYLVAILILPLFVCLQLSGEFHGGRAWRRDAWMPPLGRAHHHPATQGLHAHPCHMQADQEGEADAPTSSHGGRGPGQSHPRDGTKGSSVPRVSSALHEHMSLRALCHI